jgi:hypothetical protein
LSLPAEERRSVAAAIEEVIAALPPDTAVVCVTLVGGPPAYWYSPDAVLLARLGGGARRVVSPGDCPRAYESMVTIVDSTGRSLNPVRPLGYVDPHLVTLRAQRLVGADSAVANLDVYQGARIRRYRCHSHRESDGGWRAQCTKTGEAVSALPSTEAPQLVEHGWS